MKHRLLLFFSLLSPWLTLASTNTSTVISYFHSTIDTNTTNPITFYIDIVDGTPNQLNSLYIAVHSFISTSFYRYNKLIQINTILPSNYTKICTNLTALSTSPNTCQANGLFTYKTLTKPHDSFNDCARIKDDIKQHASCKLDEFPIHRYMVDLYENKSVPALCGLKENYITAITSDIKKYHCDGASLNVGNLITNSIYIILCFQNSRCQNVISELKTFTYPYATIFAIDSSLPDTILPSKTRVISIPSTQLPHRLHCPQERSLVPLPFYQNNSLRCGCFCPVGYELIKGKCTKSTTDTATNTHQQQCQWIQKQFTYNHMDYCDMKTCNITNLFKTIGLTTLPFPDETYLNFANNAGDTAKVLTGPRIELSIEKYKGPNMEVKNWFTPHSFTWKDFQLHRETIFSQYVHLDTSGKYIITLKAYGYTNKPAICTTVISAKDRFPPQIISKVITCPKSMACPSSIVPMTYSNYVAAQKLVSDFSLWYNSIANDAFGENKRYDQVAYSMRPIGKPSAMSMTSNNALMALTPNEITAMKQYVSSFNMTATNIPIDSGFMTKCFSAFAKPRENITYYNFPKTANENGQWIVNEISSAEVSCTAQQCFLPSSGEFFSTSAEVACKYVNSTKTLMTQKFPTTPYDPLKDIHVAASCADFTNPSCQFSDYITNLITIKSDFQSNWKPIFTALGGSISSLLRFRFYVNGGAWQEYLPTTRVTFTQLINTIMVEVYGPGGKIGGCIKFTVTLHATSSGSNFDLCANMEKIGWYQSTTGTPLNGEVRLCNYPETDFGEFSFAYDGLNDAKMISTAASYANTYLTFRGIQCTIQYMQGTTALPSTILIANTTNKVLKHFAANLIRSPTTQESTTLRMMCTSTFATPDKQILTGNCHKDLVIHDCNPVGWNCPHGDCLLQCSADKPRPNQICQGDLIDYNGNKTTYMNIPQPKQCCTSCGASSCKELSGSEPLGIKQCIVDNSEQQITYQTVSAIKLAEEEKETTTPEALSFVNKNGSSILGILGFSTLGIALLLEYQRRRRTTQQHIYIQEDQEDYRALLQ